MTAPVMIDWRQSGVCIGMDPDDFFPVAPGAPGEAEALRACAACPVREQCLAWALEVGESFGILGGLTEDERRGLRAGMPSSRPLPVLCDSGRHLVPHAESCGTCSAERRRKASAMRETTRVRDQAGRKGPRRGHRKGVKGIAA